MEQHPPKLVLILSSPRMLNDGTYAENISTVFNILGILNPIFTLFALLFITELQKNY